MTSQRRTPSKRQANHLLYEVQQLSNAAALLDRWDHGAGWKGKTLYLATVESFLIHARNLMDFLRPPAKKPRDTDSIAADYCSRHWKGRRWAGRAKDRNRINWEIAHLTSRRPLLARDWAYDHLLGKIRDEMRRFLEVADLLDDHIADELRHVLDGSPVSTPLRTVAALTAPLPRHSVPTTSMKPLG
jgi:hypothetical protein